MRSGIFRRQITDLAARVGGDRKRENGEGEENEGRESGREGAGPPGAVNLLERDDG